MNKIYPYLTLDNVALDLEIQSRKRLFEEAALLLEQSTGVSHQIIFNKLTARERLGSTFIGNKVAIPHARFQNPGKLSIAIIRTKNPIASDAPDNRSASLFFVMAIPEESADEFLEVLSHIAQMLKDKLVREHLLAASTPIELCELIQSWEFEPEQTEDMWGES